MLGFHFAMRIADIGKIEDRDISFVEIDGEPFGSVHIRGSKTDQCKLGGRIER